MYSILTSTVISNGSTRANEGYRVEGGIITHCSALENFSTEPQAIDLRGLTVLPGLLDVHIHGGRGYDTMDATYEALNEISLYKLEEGCTSFCPTTVTAPWEKMITALQNISKAMKKGVEGAQILGAFVEGPYINPKNKGAHPENCIRPVDLAEICALVEAGEGCIAGFALAPELPGALEAIAMLKKMGIPVRLGHTSATMEEAEAGVKAGANLAIHTYNAMNPLHHREPGMVGVALTHPDMYAEVICDLVHVHPATVKILAKTRGADQCVLVTDCMNAGGLPDGEYKLGELVVHVVNGISRTADGSLASSTATMMDCVRNMHQTVGFSLAKAVQMATEAPAKALGIFGKVGSLEAGKRADIIAIDADFNVKFVMVGGEIKIDRVQQIFVPLI